ncbi:hypothetical protein Pint_12731 [Pistacia integerrima]|uniref:Uncharacterized protein n=1 Tax=Pistacia integerrima TaxID=434235 RepID=A0ACC0Y8M4_9ROSI|nr:hypothetical protein Pint_12731 [Pistacia integerrima]
MDRGENEKRLEELKATIKENEGRLQNLQSTAFQLANYYFVFQGVILTAICNGVTSLRCSDRWFLFTVSLLATILNLVALCIKGLKYLRTKTQQDENWCECNELEKSRTQMNQDSTNVLPTTKDDLQKQLGDDKCIELCQGGSRCIRVCGEF